MFLSPVPFFAFESVAEQQKAESVSEQPATDAEVEDSKPQTGEPAAEAAQSEAPAETAATA